MLAKAKRAPISKRTTLKSNIPGKRIFVDTTGPFSVSVEGHKYWVQVVDDATWMGFCYFLKLRSDIANGLVKILLGIRKYGYKVCFLRCNNAGKNTRQVVDIADQEGIL